MVVVFCGELRLCASDGFLVLDILRTQLALQFSASVSGVPQACDNLNLPDFSLVRALQVLSGTLCLIYLGSSIVS